MNNTHSRKGKTIIDIKTSTPKQLIPAGTEVLIHYNERMANSPNDVYYPVDKIKGYTLDSIYKDEIELEPTLKTSEFKDNLGYYCPVFSYN